ncbi:MAG: hypothetical protein NXI16_11840 [Alphaproteobacteria bacterium]|nr:hypothetical protein [Alphaproteobacteria bacterium]
MAPEAAADRARISAALKELDHAVSSIWRLGRNLVVCWTHEDNLIRLCIVPNHQLFSMGPEMDVSFARSRWVDDDLFDDVMMEYQAHPRSIQLDLDIGDGPGELLPAMIDRVLRRYTITYSQQRAVILFDIVGFSREDPIAQVAKLNLLEYSINHANEKLRDVGFTLELARSTVGDGFYIWNRREGITADYETFLALLLMLIDNDKSKRKGKDELPPKLRTTFAIGSHYSYYQVEGTKPSGFEYIVGDVTIEAARLISACQDGQIVMSDFSCPVDRDGKKFTDAPEFILRAFDYYERKRRGEIEGFSLAEAHCYLTGGGMEGIGDSVDGFIIVDKHGYQHRCFNMVIDMTPAGGSEATIGTPNLEADFLKHQKAPLRLSPQTLQRLKT